MLEPTLAELARTAVAVASSAALATVDVDGRPIVAPVPIVDDGSGQPVTVLSNLTTHTERARRDARAAMSVADRLLLQGELLPVPGLQQLELQPRFLAHHPGLREQVESLDFSWFRLQVDRVRWTDLADDEHWMRPEDLFGAQPDPLGHLSASDLADIAARLDDELLLIMRSLGGRWLARSAELVAIDRYGIVALVDEPGRRTRSRVPFPERLNEAREMHAALASLMRAARSSPIAAGKSRSNGGFGGSASNTPGSPAGGSEANNRADMKWPDTDWDSEWEKVASEEPGKSADDAPAAEEPDADDPAVALAKRRQEAAVLRKSEFLSSTPPELGSSPIGPEPGDSHTIDLE